MKGFEITDSNGKRIEEVGKSLAGFPLFKRKGFTLEKTKELEFDAKIVTETYCYKRNGAIYFTAKSYSGYSTKKEAEEAVRKDIVRKYSFIESGESLQEIEMSRKVFYRVFKEAKMTKTDGKNLYYQYGTITIIEHLEKIKIGGKYYDNKNL